MHISSLTSLFFILSSSRLSCQHNKYIHSRFYRWNSMKQFAMLNNFHTDNVEHLNGNLLNIGHLHLSKIGIRPLIEEGPIIMRGKQVITVSWPTSLASLFFIISLTYHYSRPLLKWMGFFLHFWQKIGKI